MRIYTKGGDLPYEIITFSDSQPHFKLLHRDEWFTATIEAPIRTPLELLQVCLTGDVLRQVGYEVNLDIRYLLGARMDRAIDAMQPFTLQTIARMINSVGFSRIRILDPHSSVATNLLRATPVLPEIIVRRILTDVGDYANALVITPDAGAYERVRQLNRGYRQTRQAWKVRDPQTGKLSGFRIEDGSFVRDKHCIILDDICDGGGTFSGLADVLRREGSKSVSLFVTHGIFSKGTPITGVDVIYTTDSYKAHEPGVTTFPISMQQIP